LILSVSASFSYEIAMGFSLVGGLLMSGSMNLKVVRKIVAAYAEGTGVAGIVAGAEDMRMED
jgi:NADH:ubiquinone oxidoreductase subunit H